MKAIQSFEQSLGVTVTIPSDGSRPYRVHRGEKLVALLLYAECTKRFSRCGPRVVIPCERFMDAMSASREAVGQVCWHYLVHFPNATAWYTCDTERVTPSADIELGEDMPYGEPDQAWCVRIPMSNMTVAGAQEPTAPKPTGTYTMEFPV